jgi:hypothetical protein
MNVTPIDGPLPNEHIQATSPVMRPETVDADARLRLNFWAGRSLTGTALELEQKHRADRMVWRGRVATPGIVTGLEVALEHLESPPAPAPAPSPLDPSSYFVHVLPGQGFLASGEDIVVPRPLRVPLERVPVHYLRVGGSNRALPAEARLPDVTSSRRVSAGWFVFDVDDLPGVPMPWAAVLLLCPAEFDTFARVDPADPCDLDPSRDAFADQRRVDCCVLRLCRLPVRIKSRPDLANPDDRQWRNRLANALFEDDLLVPSRQHLRRRDTSEGPRWDTVLASAELLRWELLGVPLALLSAEGVDADRHFFLDRASVARAGGLAKFRSRPAARLTTSADDGDIALSSPGAGAPLTWRARRSTRRGDRRICNKHRRRHRGIAGSVSIRAARGLSAAIVAAVPDVGSSTGLARTLGPAARSRRGQSLLPGLVHRRSGTSRGRRSRCGARGERVAGAV